MKNKDVIAQTAEFVKQKFADESSGHDWWHLYRVWQLSKTIAKGEAKVDLQIAELAALLHDIADWKFHGGDEEAGPKAAREWLTSQQIDEADILHIEDIIRTISFKGAGVASNMKTLEGKIVHDADKLDAIGALGIARAFAYGGAMGKVMHIPGQKAVLHNNFEDYKNTKSSTVGHFYEKLLLLRDRMYTKTGKKLAEHRHKYMEQYLEEFYAEWDGKE